MMIDKVELARRVNRRAGDRKETAFQFLHLGSWREYRGHIRHRRGHWSLRNIKHGKLPLAHLDMMRHVLNCVFVWEFTHTQECPAADLVADSVAALGIHMHIAKMNIAGAVESHRRRKRRPRARDSIAMVVGDRDVLRPIKLKRQRLWTLARLLLSLRRIHITILNAIELDLIAHMVLGRELVDVSRRRCVGHNKSSLGEGVRSPDVSKCASASIAHPQARILSVPTLAQI